MPKPDAVKPGMTRGQPAPPCRVVIIQEGHRPLRPPPHQTRRLTRLVVAPHVENGSKTWKRFIIIKIQALKPSAVNLQSTWGNLGVTWVQHGVNLGVTWGQPGVIWGHLGLTWGQPVVNPW